MLAACEVAQCLLVVVILVWLPRLAPLLVLLFVKATAATIADPAARNEGYCAVGISAAVSGDTRWLLLDATSPGTALVVASLVAIAASIVAAVL